MATSTLQPYNIVNRALRMLGDDSLTSVEYAAATLRRAAIANEFYAVCRDAVLTEHPWNFAMKRTTLYAYTLPAADLTLAATSGSAIQFSTSASVFAATDVGREIREDDGPGRAEIVTFNSAASVDVDISATFSTTSFVSGDWRFYYLFPAWGPSRSILVPSDCLRVWRLENNEEYQVEAGYIVLDQDSLNVKYMRQETDTTKFSFPFVEALATYLAAIMAEPITGQHIKGELFLKKYAALLARAKSTDGQEGTPETLESNALIDVR